MKRFLIQLLCAVLAVACAKETSLENMSESAIKQKLIGNTWTAIKKIDYSIDGKVIDKSTSSDDYWAQKEWTFSEDGRVMVSNESDICMCYFSVIENKLIFRFVILATSIEVPYTIKKLTNSTLVIETQHETNVENWECSYSELYFKKE